MHLSTCQQPTRAHLVCYPTLHYRPFTGEQTGQPNTDTVSGFWSSNLCPKNSFHIQRVGLVLFYSKSVNKSYTAINYVFVSTTDVVTCEIFKGVDQCSHQNASLDMFYRVFLLYNPNCPGEATLSVLFPIVECLVCILEAICI